MKNIVTTVLITIAINVVSQKDDSTYSWGINIDQRLRLANYSESGYWIPLSLFATISNDKNQFEFGPQAYLTEFRRGYKTGVSFNYKYYPNGRLNRFSSYFSPSVVLQFGKEEFQAYRYVPMTQTEHFGNGVYKTLFGLLGVGYGIEVGIPDKMYIGTDIRFFCGFGPSKAIEEFDSPELNNTETTYYLHLYGQAGINIGYRF